MAKTLAQIQAQINKLQQEAGALRAKEIAGVVARIREAIDHYGLTEVDLFGPRAAARGGKRGARAGVAVKAVKATKATKPAAKPPAPAKYRDEQGRSWSGHGKRPNWFKDALASGKTAADLLIKP